MLIEYSVMKYFDSEIFEWLFKKKEKRIQFDSFWTLHEKLFFVTFKGQIQHI